MEPDPHPAQYGYRLWRPRTRTVGEALAAAGARLTGLPDGSPRLEAELLLGEATGLSRTRILTWPDTPLTSDALRRLAGLVERRRGGEPIAYILGRQGFWTLDLEVTPDTLIPRPETELLVELALARLPARAPLTVADLGTGSGAIAAALAAERPAWTLIALDRSPAAIAVARANARRLALPNLLPLVGHWFCPLALGSLDAVVSNPPYVAASDPHLGRGDLRFEPHAALASGPDGLDAIRHIAAEAQRHLRPGGLLALEHGYDQGAAVRAILGSAGWLGIETRRDLAGHERVTLASPIRP
jgi:release factor glutamine methyltransferase